MKGSELQMSLFVRDAEHRLSQDGPSSPVGVLAGGLTQPRFWLPSFRRYLSKPFPKCAHFRAQSSFLLRGALLVPFSCVLHFSSASQ